jgi:hypothetical protein
LELCPQLVFAFDIDIPGSTPEWSRLEEEGAESCKGEGKLTAGVAGVAEERAATPAAFGKEESFWARWWPLPLLSPPPLQSRW